MGRPPWALCGHPRMTCKGPSRAIRRHGPDRTSIVLADNKDRRFNYRSVDPMFPEFADGQTSLLRNAGDRVVSGPGGRVVAHPAPAGGLYLASPGSAGRVMPQLAGPLFGNRLQSWEVRKFACDGLRDIAGELFVLSAER